MGDGPRPDTEVSADAGAMARRTGFDRSRHALAHVTLLMVVLSATFAAVGSWIGSEYLADEALLALSSGPASPTTARGAPVTTPSVGSDQDQADPTTQLDPPDDSPQARGLDALTAISYPWSDKLPGWTIDFQEGRTGLYGLTLVEEKRIEIYVRSDQSRELLIHIVAHEIGHAVDVTLNDGPDRRRWQGARNIGDAPWWPDSGASDFQTGAGDFAEGFAYWQTRTGNYRSKLGPAPDDAQIELMAELAYD